MAKFITGNALNLELEKIFEDAEEQLVLISPFIKLHQRFIAALKSKLDNHKLEITIIFGKNEADKSRSMQESDFEFLKSFPNIRIYYEQHLHAKYYANESHAILTSMNLYDYSQNNNIEFGVLTKTSLLQGLANNFVSNVTGDNQLDTEAFKYFEKVKDQAELLFDKEPQFESTLLGLSRKYVRFITIEDKLTEFFKGKSGRIPREVSAPSTVVTQKKGYCIRTRKEIQFNLEQPLSDEALESWKKFNNKDYPEKYCHFSGEPSQGLTSFAKPILRKNWAKAKEIHHL